MTRDRVTGILSMMLGIVVLILTSQLPASAMANDIGPRVFPYICSSLLLNCGGGLALKGNTASKPFADRAGYRRMALILGVIFFYAVAMYLFSFTIPTIITLSVISWLFKPKETRTKKGAAACVLYGALMTVGIYLLFGVALKLRLPTGILF